jgi:hypothetical protein
MGPQTHNFTNPKASTVDSLEQNPMLEVVGRVKQAQYFLYTENDRQSLDLWTRWYLETCFIPVADISVKTDNGREIVVAGPP